MEKIRIEGQEFELEIKKKRMMSLRLKMKEKNKIEISVGFWTPEILIRKFLMDNGGWILKQNEKLSVNKDVKKIKKMEILGEKYEVKLLKSTRDSLVFIDKTIYINYSQEKKIKEIIDKKMRVLALKLIKEKVKELAKKFSLKFEKVSVKNQSSRFGSCSSHGSLNFNWQIIFFPLDKCEHVICHELAHLTVKNHSRDFWELLGKYDNNWQKNNKWLKKEGTKRFIV